MPINNHKFSGPKKVMLYFLATIVDCGLKLETLIFSLFFASNFGLLWHGNLDDEPFFYYLGLICIPIYLVIQLLITEMFEINQPIGFIQKVLRKLEALFFAMLTSLPIRSDSPRNARLAVKFGSYFCIIPVTTYLTNWWLYVLRQSTTFQQEVLKRISGPISPSILLLVSWVFIILSMLEALLEKECRWMPFHLLYLSSGITY